MFREFREATVSILKHHPKFTPRYQLTFKYMAWVHKKMRQEPTFFQGFLNNKGIIMARNAFLIEERLDGVGEHIVRLAKDFAADSMTRSTSSKTLEETLKQPLDSATTKILIIPVAIVGSGKTTLARVLSSVSPRSFAHIQSDNVFSKKNAAAQFTKAVIEAFKTHDVVYADKNNHLFQHRQTICREFKQLYPGGSVVLLDWQVEKHDRSRVIQFCKNRIMSRYDFYVTDNCRGENHQCLTPSLVPQFEGIIRNFISKRDPVDVTLPADSLVDRIVSMDLFGELRDNLERACRQLSWTVPSQSDLQSLILDATLVKVTVSRKNSPSKPRVMYYAVELQDFDLVTILDNLFKEYPEFWSQWMQFKSKIESEKKWHITLATRYAHPTLFAQYHQEFLERKQKRIDREMQIKRDMKNASKKGIMLAPTPQQAKSEPDTIENIRVVSVVWDTKAMAVIVQLPSCVKSGNSIAHISVSQLDPETPASYSNVLLENFKRGSVSHLPILEIVTRGVLQSFPN